MAKPKHRIGLFAKFSLVILFLGIVPIILLTTIMQGSLLKEYRHSLEKTYQEALLYASYSIKTRLDGYNDISKFCYSYNAASVSSSVYSLENYDTLRQILTGEAYRSLPDPQMMTRQEMERFLKYICTIDSDIKAAHFIYAPPDKKPIVYHYCDFANPTFDDQIFEEQIGFADLDKDSRKQILIPSHRTDYIKYPSLPDKWVFTIARNYYDLTKPVGQETYVGTVYLDISLNALGSSISTLDLAQNGTVYVTNAEGNCLYATNEDKIGQPITLHADTSLCGSVSEYGLTVWYAADNFPMETRICAIRNSMYLVIVVSIAGLLGGLLFFSRKLTRPIRDLVHRMAEVESGQFQGEIPVTSNDELADLTARFNRMSSQLDIYTKQVYLSKIKQTEAELNALKSQIYPHFLYNTLEIIRMTALTRHDDMVAEMVEALSDQIRYVIGKVDDLVPLRQEIDILHKYVYLLNCRFKDKIIFSCQCSQMEDCLIPKLILQPLVENAFIHGIKPMQGQGFIQLSAERAESNIVLTVMDNGVGMSPEALESLNALLRSDQPGRKSDTSWCSIGLKNVHDRLQYLYGKEYGLTIFSSPGVGTVVKLKVPGTLGQNTAEGGASHA